MLVSITFVFHQFSIMSAFPSIIIIIILSNSKMVEREPFLKMLALENCRFHHADSPGRDLLCAGLSSCILHEQEVTSN